MGTSADDDAEIGEIVAFWPEGASPEKRDAHHRAERWSHLLTWQVDRLYASRRQALESHSRLRAASHYPDEARWLFFELEGEAHFALVAARQLLRALRAFDGNDRLPDGLTNAQLRDVRDALEHWDTPGGSEAARRLEKRGALASSHKWSPEGPGLLGDIISDAVLARWGADVYREMLEWDPYYGWRNPQG